MKKIILASVMIFAMLFSITGCGSSSGGRTYETTEAIPEVPNTGGDALVVTNSGEGDIGMSYTKLDNGSVLVECDGEGGCGDILVGSEVTSSGEATDGGASTTGGPGSCEDGFVWCSVENKCVPE